MEAILGEHGVVCIDRQGSEMASLLNTVDMFSRHRENIHLVQPMAQNTVSSSAIRAILKAGHSAAYLLPDAVLAYIDEHNLYDCHTDQHLH